MGQGRGGFRLAAAVALLAVTAGLAVPAGASEAADSALTAILQGRGDTTTPPLVGLAAIRVRQGRVVTEFYGGTRRYEGGTALPVEADTLFRVASVSKIVTTIAVMQLVEQGRVDLDADASDYLGFRLRNPSWPDRVITVRMLIDHTSSLRDGEIYNFPPGQDIATVFAGVGPSGDHFAHEAGRQPGAYYEYCNLAYGVLGTLVERVSGQRFDHYASEKVLRPLGIDGGFYGPELPHPERLATLYRRVDGQPVPVYDDRPLKTHDAAALTAYVPGRNGTLFSPQGGLRVSVRGLARLGAMLMGNGAVDGVRVLRPDTVRLMEQAQWVFDGHNGTPDTADRGPIDCYGLTLITLLGNPGDDLPFPGYHGHLHGHLGEAYALHSGLWYDRETGDGYFYVATGFPPDDQVRRGDHSAFTRVEEEIFAALAAADD